MLEFWKRLRAALDPDPGSGYISNMDVIYLFLCFFFFFLSLRLTEHRLQWGRSRSISLIFLSNKLSIFTKNNFIKTNYLVFVLYSRIHVIALFVFHTLCPNFFGSRFVPQSYLTLPNPRISPVNTKGLLV